MMVVYERIVGLAAEQHVSLLKLCEELQISKNTIANWKTRDPKPDNLIAVANYFHVSTDYLYGLTDDRNAYRSTKSLPPKRLELIHFLEDASLTEKQSQTILTTIQDMMRYHHCSTSLPDSTASQPKIGRAHV